MGVMQVGLHGVIMFTLIYAKLRYVTVSWRV